MWDCATCSAVQLSQLCSHKKVGGRRSKALRLVKEVNDEAVGGDSKGTKCVLSVTHLDNEALSSANEHNKLLYIETPAA